MVLVDLKLSKYSMKWMTSPYRIVNRYGVIVQKKVFDLRDDVLADQENLGKQRPIFQKTSPSTFNENKIS